ncbi:MAG: hypothetical protein K2P94_03160, partial [Rhodospirillaceae bacterium]|nr:hypothetical protein [Rhodospirillaceae bacterium]
MPTFKTVSLKSFAAAAVLSLAMSAPAQAQSDVSSRINKLEQDVQRLQRGSGGKGAPIADAPNAEGMADLLQRVLALENIVQQLTGQIEETRFNADRTAKQTQILQDDVSLRLARIEQSLGMNGAPPPGQQGQLVPTPAAPATAPAEPAIAERAPPMPARSAGDSMSEPVSQQPSARAAAPPSSSVAQANVA